MKLHTLTAKNFMPYRGEMEIAFPQEEARNVMIVFGDNMRGKTSLMNAIRWAFYGEALGRHSRPIPLHEIVNKEAIRLDDWKVEVHVKFDANGHIYDLRRVADRKRIVANPSKPEDFDQTIHLTRDGAAINGDQIEAEINLFAPQKISRFFLFDGELLQEYETLLIEDSQQGQQIKEAIEQVLGVPALINGREDIQTILKQAQKKQNSDLKQIHGLETQARRQEELTALLDSIDRDLLKLETKLKDVRDERTHLEDEIESSQSVFSAKTTLDLKRSDQKSLLDECDLKRDERLDRISGAWRDLVDAKLGVRRVQLERKHQELVASIKKYTGLEGKISDLNKLLDTKECPTCGQILGEEMRAQIGRNLGVAEAEIAEIQDSTASMQEISGQLNALSKIRGTNARERLQQIEKDLQRYQIRLTKTENEIENLSDQIAGYDTAELSRKRTLLNEKVKEEGRLQENIKDQKLARKKLNDELAISQKAIEGLTKDRTQRSTVKVSVCSDLERIFSQSIEQLRDRLRKQVESLANEAFKNMTTQESYRGLEINDNYGLQIVDRTGSHVTIRSAGAEQIVALSLIDGLNRTGRSSGPVIMDTPFGRLDLKHRDNILTYLPSVTSQFVLLVHSGEIRRETDLAAIANRIGAVYEITEVSSTESRVERAAV